MNKSSQVSNLYLISLLLVVLVQGLSGDDLLFHSDIFSYMYFNLGLIAVVFLVLLVGFLVCAIVLRREVERLGKGIERAPLVVIIAGFLFFSCETFVYEIKDIRWFAFALTVTFIVVSVAVSRLPDLTQVLRRVNVVARTIATGGLLTLISMFALAKTPELVATPMADGEPRHAILIVVDGFPSHFLKTYLPDAHETVFDRVLSQGLVFSNARSNKVYTSGFFGILYSGRLDMSLGGRVNGSMEKNLLNVLQKHGVSTRWVSFHANGIPEGNTITRYAGLRSALLTENWNWLPSLLGLNYHTFVVWDDTRKYMGERIDTVYRVMNGQTNEDAVWENNIERQIAEVQSGHRPSFLLVHVSFTKHLVQALSDYGRDEAELREFYARAIKSDYRYQLEDEPIVDKLRRQYRSRANEYGQRIKGLLTYLKETERLGNTLLIVTADHGSILSNNKIWYGFHNDEKVAKVPLVLFGRRLSGVDDRLADTTDLSQTIVDYFGLNEPITNNGVSLLQPSTKSHVVVLTIPSAKHKEHFVNLYTRNQKFVLNIHPEGTGESWSTVLDGYKDVQVRSPIKPHNPVWMHLRKALVGFGLQAKDVHPMFRRMVVKASGIADSDYPDRRGSWEK